MTTFAITSDVETIEFLFPRGELLLLIKFINSPLGIILQPKYI